MHQIPGLYIKEVDGKGKCVFTGSDINEGDLIEVCQTIIIPKREVQILHRTVLHDYYFSWSDSMEEAAIALGFGSIYNHAIESNADFILDFEHNTIDIVAISNIKAGSEITLNYHGEKGDDTPLWFKMI
ncbi:MAG TPA: SET domain-containing protein-lysine N-methyltransferase [Saprospiraceae bacterium]|nr:SET domain-containing protein-lysine N-methyltransferase [Saprospiraceae bacterium]